jgi:hypothetical protein
MKKYQKKARLRFAEILGIPEGQAKASPLLTKLVRDAENGCILFNSNQKKLFYITGRPSNKGLRDRNCAS